MYGRSSGQINLKMVPFQKAAINFKIRDPQETPQVLSSQNFFSFSSMPLTQATGSLKPRYKFQQFDKTKNIIAGNLAPVYPSQDPISMRVKAIIQEFFISFANFKHLKVSEEALKQFCLMASRYIFSLISGSFHAMKYRYDIYSLSRPVVYTGSPMLALNSNSLLYEFIRTFRDKQDEYPRRVSAPTDPANLHELGQKILTVGRENFRLTACILKNGQDLLTTVNNKSMPQNGSQTQKVIEISQDLLGGKVYREERLKRRQVLSKDVMFYMEQSDFFTPYDVAVQGINKHF